MERVTVFLGLGSNLGSREDNLAQAIRLLASPARSAHRPAKDGAARHEIRSEIRIARVSSVYQTAPWGYADQPDFLNCVVEAQTTLSPGELLEQTQAVENSLGRQPSVRYGPRRIDVDILLYDGRIIDQPGLQVPHPRLHQRAFVLAPLAELCPHLEHPVLKASIEALASQVDGREGVSLWGPCPSVQVDNHCGLSHS